MIKEIIDILMATIAIVVGLPRDTLKRPRRDLRKCRPKKNPGSADGAARIFSLQSKLRWPAGRTGWRPEYPAGRTSKSVRWRR